VACPTPQHFPTLSNKGHDFGKKKKVIENNLCVLISSTTLSKTFLVLAIIQRDISQMDRGLHVK
jgi:hypothetical protein